MGRSEIAERSASLEHGSRAAGLESRRVWPDPNTPRCSLHSPLPGRELASIIHFISCPYCQRTFDVFAALWCAHQEDQPSKVCPHCDRCLCAHPAYAEPHFWRDSPAVFHDRGFTRLFLFYL